jgi:hypothetical protein
MGHSQVSSVSDLRFLLAFPRALPRLTLDARIAGLLMLLE